MATTSFGERLERRIRERAGQIGARAAVRMEVNLKRNFQPHRKSGATQAATTVRLESVTSTSLTYVAKADTPQARWVNDGTRPHPIAPRARPWHVGGPKFPPARRQPGESGPVNLSFVWEKAGGRITIRWVEHPGYRGSGWWDFTIAQWHDVLVDSL